MKRKILGLLVFLGLAVGGMPAANAVVITFEGHQNTVYTSPITRLGFDIGNPVGQLQHFHEITSTAFGLPNNGTGVLLNDRNTQIFVEANGGGAFTFTSVDVASALNNGPAVDLRIEGFLSNVSVGTIDVIGLGTGYTNVANAAFGDIDRLIFDGLLGEGGFVLDNLTLNESSTVPEPTTLLLLGLGLAGLGCARRTQT